MLKILPFKYVPYSTSFSPSLSSSSSCTRTIYLLVTSPLPLFYSIQPPCNLKKMFILDKISDLIPLMFEIPEYSLPPPYWLKHKGHIVWHVMQSPPHLVYITVITSTQEIKPVKTKGDQAWLFIGRTNVEAEAPVLWAPAMTSWLFGKDPDAGKDWMQEKGVTEDEVVGWHHWLNGHEFEQAPGDDEG